MLLETKLYPDANTVDTFQSGAEFLDFVMIVMRGRGLYLQPFTSMKSQFAIGESLGGWEVKLDRRFTDTGRLSIEIAERTRLDRPWVPSGIYRDDNTWLYIQGNFEYFFLFQRKFLVMLHKTGRYGPENKLATIQTFYLPLPEAEKYGEKIVPNANDEMVKAMRARATKPEYARR